jgi:hypothetical protein
MVSAHLLANYSIQMETSTSDSIKILTRMDSGKWHTSMETHTKGNGRMIARMGRVDLNMDQSKEPYT